MTDREFIELLNTYVDREISPADSVRLESEVAQNRGRRAVYDEYCRIHKACSMLSEESFKAPAAHPIAALVSFPTRSWRYGAFATCLGAAAAIAVFIGMRGTSPLAGAPHSEVAAQANPAADLAAQRSDASPMKPVFFVRLPDQPGRTRQPLLESDAAAQVAQLSWIGDIHISPVPAAPGADFLLGAKGDIKSAVASEPQAAQDQEPLEMTAFRFQR